MAEVSPFSWSLRRHRLWSGCRYRYYLQYYGSRGGHEPGADLELRRRHAARALVGRSTLIRDLYAHLIRQEFYGAEELPDEPPDLTPAALNRFRFLLGKMVSGAWERDHSLPMLAELLAEHANWRSLAMEIEEEIAGSGKLFSSGDWLWLRRTPRLERKFIESPLPLQIAELQCYATPLIARSDHTGCWIVAGNEPAPDEEELVALLGKFHAFNAWRTPPEQCHLLVFNCEGFREIGLYLDVSAALRIIRDDVGAMMELHARSDDPAAWPPAPGPECAYCKFRFVCDAAARK